MTPVTKVTTNQIHTHSSRYWRENGKAATRHSTGEVCQDSVAWKQFVDKKAAEQEQRDINERKIAERNARETYKLACQIVNQVSPTESIMALEGLGVEKLKLILTWLEH